MSVKSLPEDPGVTITEEDQARIDAILAFWFKEQELSAPQIDRRMDIWFGEDQAFDHEIRQEFAADVEQATAGELDHWAQDPRGRLALIILLDQFRRNIHRGTAGAYEKDNVALKLCVEGAMEKKDKGLTPIQRVFFYMPLQHAESRKVQAKSTAIFNKIAQRHCRAIRSLPAPERRARTRKHTRRRRIPRRRQPGLRAGLEQKFIFVAGPRPVY
jgi:uncharacterized protein (DUF924 family)